ncbi:MAG: YhdH/YhfP family quinone oxidoreductase [Gammaproteobacteria bacterium]|nr:YhdH/YhfP family quinone oxidoreductase [Gammaproteobacteria bacterium]
MPDTYTAFQVTKTGDRTYERQVTDLEIAGLPDGDLLIKVEYSSLNYKDALSATGNPGVTRNFPHTPGIDVAGTVVESGSDSFAVGDSVIVIGFDLGMNTPGGFGQYVRIPSKWAVSLPSGLSSRESMILGTAGFTAALCVHKLEKFGMSPSGGPVLVSGSTGGVGSIAVQLLNQLGYEVHAITGKADQADFLKGIGASEVHSREAFEEESNRPLSREMWGGVVDTVGGVILVNAIKALKYGSSAAACGLVSSPAIPATVFPFILRHVNLLGIDSVELPIEEKKEIWDKLAGPWHIGDLEKFVESLTLDTLSDAIDRILKGQMVGRGLVTLPT